MKRAASSRSSRGPRPERAPGAAPPADAGEPLGLRGYLAPEGYESVLREEIGGAHDEIGRLLLAPARDEDPAWAADVWRDVRKIRIASIVDGARKLRAIQRNWALYSARLHRRAALIAEALPPVSARPLRFPEPPPDAPLGAFTLQGADTIIASPRCAQPVPLGAYRFVEDREGPPSRAYLKLWEALTRAGAIPAPGERCVDLGASPGGFTWALADLGAQVVAVDRAPLAPAVRGRENVVELRRDAFSLDPLELGPVDWLVADIACYPRKLLELLTRWRRAGAYRRAICTLKFQGKTDHGAARALSQTLGGRLRHLHHNGHELTWVDVDGAAPAP